MEQQRKYFEDQRKRDQEYMEQRERALEQEKREMLARAQALSTSPSPTSPLSQQSPQGSVGGRRILNAPQAGAMRREISGLPKTHAEQVTDSVTKARAMDTALLRASKGKLLSFTLDPIKAMRGFCDVCFIPLGLNEYLSMSKPLLI